MSKITYPCETAAIFQDVIFVISPQNREHLMYEIDKAEKFYLSYFPYATLIDVWDGIRYSFNGLYLTAMQAIERRMYEANHLHPQPLHPNNPHTPASALSELGCNASEESA